MSNGHTALVTGSTSGLGRALAGALAFAGVTVGIVGRDAGKVEAVRAEIAAAPGDSTVPPGDSTVPPGDSTVREFVADLSSQADDHRLADEVTAALPGLDILIHCAAVYARHRTVTVDGLETMFATNVLAPFLLTELLRNRLVANAPSRIVIVSAPSTTKLDFDDLQGERRFRSLTAFGASKAADLILAFELARRLEGTGVTANAVHPGLMRTNLMQQAPAPMRWGLRLVSAPPARAASAVAPLALAAEYEGKSGRFYKGGRDRAAFWHAGSRSRASVVGGQRSAHQPHSAGIGLD